MIKAEGSSQGKGGQRGRRRGSGWKWEIIKREGKDRADFQRIGRRGRTWWQTHLTVRSQGRTAGMLGSTRMPADHRQPLSLKGDLKVAYWRQFSVHPNNPLTLWPQHFQLSLEWGTEPDTNSPTAGKGEAAGDKTSPNLVKACPKPSCSSGSAQQNLLFQSSCPAHSVLGDFSSTTVHCLLVIILIKITLQAWLWNTKHRCYKL